MITILVIVGPTASGKSELAIQIAKKCNGEIISADSRQIYIHLNIGTAKVAGRYAAVKLPAQSGTSTVKKFFIYKGIPHHCIDIITPRRIITAYEFKKIAESAIRDIARRGKLPIVVGGTGFWIDTLLGRCAMPSVPPDWTLRRRLEKKTPANLFSVLKKLDPGRALHIDPKNPRRLIRAIEIVRSLGKVPPIKTTSPYQALWLGIKISQETLRKKIAARARAMIRRGLVGEIKKLLKHGVSKKRIREFGFEYRLALDFLEKKIERSALEKKLIQETYRYAKRQMRWFRRNPNIHWVRKPARAIKIISRRARCSPRARMDSGAARSGRAQTLDFAHAP